MDHQKSNEKTGIGHDLISDSFLSEVTTDIYKKYRHQLKDITLIFPNKRPIVYVRKYLSTIAGKTILAPKMLTIQDFLKSQTELTIAEDIQAYFALWDAYQTFSKQQTSPEAFYAVGQMLLSDFNQLDTYLVDKDSLFTIMEDEARLRSQFEEFDEEQKEILSRFWSGFKPENNSRIHQQFLELWGILPKINQRFEEILVEMGLISSGTLYRQLATGMLKIVLPEKLIVIGFNALNACEAKLFKQWQDDSKAEFYFDTDAYYMKNDVQEAGFFLRQNLYKIGLINAYQGNDDRIRKGKTQIKVFPVNGYNGQAKLLNQYLKSYPKDHFNLPNKGAIILADEKLIIPVLQAIPDDIKINITMGYPINQSTLFTFVNTWIQLQEDLYDKKYLTVNRSLLLEFLLSPLFDKSQLYEYIIQENRFSKQKDLQINDINATDKLLIETLRKKNDSLDVLESLSNIIRQIVEDQKEKNTINEISASLCLSLYQTINQLSAVLRRQKFKTTLQMTLRFLRKNISKITAPMEGEPLAGLQVIGLMETRNLDFEEIYLVGASEEMMSTSGQSHSLIPESLRKAFGLPTISDRNALLAYIFYRLMHHTQTLNLIYDQNSSSGAGEPTHYLRQLEFESSLPIQWHQQESLPIALPKPTHVKIIEKTPVIMERIYELLVHSEKGISASAVKTYLECPLRFYFKYIARIKEPEDHTNKALLLGKLVHSLMDNFYRPFKEAKTIISSEAINQKMSELSALAEKTYLEKSKMKVYELRGEDRVNTAIMEYIATSFINHDRQGVAPFRIMELEKDYPPTPIEVFFQDKSYTVKLQGFMDRIDDCNGNIRIVDYKTGSDDPQLGDLSQLFNREAKSIPSAFQLLFYSMIYAKWHDGRLAMPHIYTVKHLKNDNSEFNIKNKAERDMPFDEVLAYFEEGLKDVLAEILNPDIPFMHNENNKYCSKSEYALFCLGNAESMEDEEEEATE